MTESCDQQWSADVAVDHRRRPQLTLMQLLAWADAHHDRTGHWPGQQSGPIPESPGDTWNRVASALHFGHRGLPSGMSLARLFAQQRGARHFLDPPPLTVAQILQWCDWHLARTGDWPSSLSGSIPEAPGESWRGVDRALILGKRGLDGGSSLAKLVVRERKARKSAYAPRLTQELILTWATAHRQRTGLWPTRDSGCISEAPGENWLAVSAALRYGLRGLRGGSSLAGLLHKYRRVPARFFLEPLSEEQILRWAEVYYRRHGRWPTSTSGPIPASDGETWSSVDSFLRRGRRGIGGGSSLAMLLSEQRLRQHPQSRRDLTYTCILRWADQHHAETGQWPQGHFGKIHHTRAEVWANVDKALRDGARGLPGGSSLAQLLAARRGVRNIRDLPPLNCEEILAWAAAHHTRTGRWPTASSGSIFEAPTETWRGVNHALQRGRRRLPGGSSLSRLLCDLRQAARCRGGMPIPRKQEELPRLNS